MKKLFIFISFFLASSLFAQLKNQDNQADYIIIYHPKFEEGLTDYISWRESKGYNVKPVSVETIYEEFSDTSLNSEKIKEFISYAYNNWQDPKPQYLLLVGDIEYIPSNCVKSNLSEYNDADSVLVDQNYVLDENSKNLFMAIGRIPCNTISDLKNIIDKTIAIEDEEINLEEKKNFVVLSDSDSSSTDISIFEGIAEGFVKNIDEIDNDIFNFESYAIRNGSSNYIAADQLVQNELDDAYFLAYYGHANPFTWSKEKYLLADDFDMLSDTSHPFLLTSAACSQSFDISDSLTIVEKLLFYENKGTFLSITASGTVYLVQSSKMFESFYKNLLNSEAVVGDALVESINLYNYEYNRRFTLLGDPALKLKLQVIANVNDNETALPNSFALEQNYPNPFNPETVISYQVAVDSKVQLKVFDMLGREVISLVNKQQSAGRYSVNFNASNLTSGVYIYRLTAGDFNASKKLILLK